MLNRRVESTAFFFVPAHTVRETAFHLFITVGSSQTIQLSTLTHIAFDQLALQSHCVVTGCCKICKSRFLFASSTASLFLDNTSSNSSLRSVNTQCHIYETNTTINLTSILVRLMVVLALHIK